MYKNTLFKLAVSFALVLTLVVPMNMWAFAGDDTEATGDGQGKCTAFYMGKDTTESGAYVWGRSEDYSTSSRKLMEVHPAEDHAPGDMFKTNAPEDFPDFEWPYPAHTLRYLLCKDSFYNDRYSGQEPYAEVGMNEKNVSITATVTLSRINATIYAADPLIRGGGLTEPDVTSIVLMQAETARGACELVAGIIDKVGAGYNFSDYGDGFTVSDPNEAWFFQWLSGHQYVAVKLRDDKLGFSPNLTGNVGTCDEQGVDVNDTANVIASPELVSLPARLGVLVTDSHGHIKISNTYARLDTYHNPRANRLRVGYGYFYGLTTQAQIDARYPSGNQFMDFYLDPPEGKKYSLYEAMRFLACRGEGTSWENGNPTGNSSAIGNDATQECHVFELRPWMPAELSTVEWIAMGPAEFSVYLPYYGSLITDVYGKYNFRDQQNYDASDIYNNTFWHIARRIHTLAKGPGTSNAAQRIKYGKGVKDFWEAYQKSLIEQQALVDAYMLKVLKEQGLEAAQQAATAMSMKLAEDTYEYSVRLVNELTAFTASPVGDFVPTFSAIPAYAPDNLVFLHLSADAVSYISGDVCYTVSVSNAKDVLAVELEFVIDGAMLSGKSLAGLNGFAPMNGILWTYAGDGLWKGAVTLALPSETTTGLTSEAPVDIAEFAYLPKTYGNAAMAITSAKVVGLYGDTTKYLIPVIANDTATTIIARSKYDLNRDGVVDALDLGIMLLYCGFNADSADWGALVKVNDIWGNGVTANMCDVNSDGIIDMLDLLDLFIHYTK
ncbi:MAG: C69 family dipeptidase [Clostridiales bacterium]|nr:C69 family dipeptidase [Clostridiales bacterium]